MDKEKIEKLKEIIEEIEEEIGIEMFITVVEKEGTSCKEIAEKIKRCEKLGEEYTAKIAELELESGEKNAVYERTKIGLIKEIEELRSMKSELKDDKEIVDETGRAAPKNERIAEEKAGAIEIAAGANEKTEREVYERTKIGLIKEIEELRSMKSELRDDKEIVEETGHAAPKNERIAEEKAGAIGIAAGANEKIEREVNAIIKVREAEGADASAKEGEEEVADEMGRAAPKNEGIAEEKAGAVGVAAGERRNTEGETDKNEIRRKRKYRQVQDVEDVNHTVRTVFLGPLYKNPTLPGPKLSSCSIVFPN